MRLVAAVIAFSLITTLHATEILGSQFLNELKRKKINDALTKICDDVRKIKEDIKELKSSPVFKSCKEILASRSDAKSGIYTISDGENGEMKVYCQMSSVAGCSGGGWTMVMKIDGSKSTFRYSSSYWTNKDTYNDNGSNGGLDNREYKGSTYWKTSFNEICLALKCDGQLKAYSFSYPASSLYHLIADGKYRQTHIVRSHLKQLIRGSSLQYRCNLLQGFNVQPSNLTRSRITRRVRLGIMSNNENNNCKTSDSYIGLGGEGKKNFCGFSNSLNTAGNVALSNSENGNRDTKAMGYLLVR